MSITLALALPPAFGGASRSSYCNMVVGKAHLNAPPTKQVTDGQLALQSLLAKRRQRYHAKRKRERGSGVDTNKAIENGGILIDNTAKEGIRNVHEKRSVLCLASNLHVQSMRAHSDGVIHHPAGNNRVDMVYTTNPSTRSGSNLATLDCEELADRVVSKAKVRLKRRKRMISTIRKISTNPSSPQLTGTSAIRASTPILLHPVPKASTPISLSPVKKEHVAEPVKRILNLSLDSALTNARNGSNKCGLKAKKVVYLSEKQSITSKDTGIPCVPPSSPQLDLCHENIKYVPSLSDLKSQRELKNRLHAITVKNQEAAEKEIQLQLEREKRLKKEATMRLKAQQRAEIYALNKVMAEFERQKFETFMSGKV